MQSLSKPDRTGIVTITQAIFYQQLTEVVRAHDRPEYPFWQSATYQIAKRCLDICVALVGLAVLVLPLPILGLLIFLEDHHSIFYKQQRRRLAWPSIYGVQIAHHDC